MKKIIFFDIDKTLIDENYNYEDGLYVVNELKKLGFEVILNSSKTRAEQEYYRKIFGLTTPFISENGSGVFVPDGYLKVNEGVKRDGYIVIELGVPYETVVATLNQYAQEYGLKFYANSTLQEIMEFLSMSEELARLAMQREYSETIFEYSKRGFEKELEKYNLTCQMGSRFIAVLGPTNKGKGMKKLLDIYRENFGELEVFAAGDGENDFPMFEPADKSFLIGDKNFPGAIKLKNIRELLKFV